MRTPTPQVGYRYQYCDVVTGRTRILRVSSVVGEAVVCTVERADGRPREVGSAVLLPDNIQYTLLPDDSRTKKEGRP